MSTVAQIRAQMTPEQAAFWAELETWKLVRVLQETAVAINGLSPVLAPAAQAVLIAADRLEKGHRIVGESRPANADHAVELAYLTNDAHAAPAYGKDWWRCCSIALECWPDMTLAERVMRSTLPRWAADLAKTDTPTATDFRHYIEREPEIVEDLVAEIKLELERER